ncbi:Gfo/Idh/MocA family oxidoreductase [Candidatus Poribacteria bacterium]|nr:Gfo/Idh/MocA family oxidoreductase [Candidatus Poribacteria bacterium]
MSTLRVGYVGTGGNAQGHLKRLAAMEGVEIAACCDVSEERAKSSAATHGGQAYTDARKMLDEVEMEVCYFSLPPFAHEGVEIAAAERGLHIFVEKPVVMDVETGVATKEAIDRAGVFSCVGYQLRYNSNADGLRTFLADKRVTLAVSERWGGIAGGSTHWWRVMDKSGGMLHEQATHQLDLLRYFAGDIVEVTKLESLRVNTDQENHTIPDAEVVLLQYASGAIGYITTTSALTNGGGGSRIELVVEGHLRIQYADGVRVLPDGAATVPIPPTPQPTSIDDAFIQAIRTNDRSLVKSDYTDGLKTCLVTVAANQSAREGKPVRVTAV